MPWPSVDSEVVLCVQAVETARTEVFRAVVAVQRSQTTVCVASDEASDPMLAVVQRRPVGRVENTASCVTPEIHAGVFGQEDPILAVAIDRVVRDVRLRGSVNIDPVSAVSADRVTDDTRRRRERDADSVQAVVPNDVRARHGIYRRTETDEK